MPEQLYKPVKFFSTDVTEADEFVTDEDGEILTDEDDNPITAD